MHVLKTWPDEFQAVADGKKTAEFRVDDRGFNVGDDLILCEYDPNLRCITGRRVYVFVTHVVRGPAFGIPEGCVMMSIKK